MNATTLNIDDNWEARKRNGVAINTRKTGAAPHHSRRPAYGYVRIGRWSLCLLVLVGLLKDFSDAQTLHSTIDGIRAGERFGISLGGNVRLDDDPFPDIVVGATAGTPGGPVDGRVYVFSGEDRQLVATLAGNPVEDETDHDRFGSSFDILNDTNGDDIPDIIVGAPGTFNSNIKGYVRFFAGGTWGTLGVVRASSINTLFGTSVSSVNDVTGDGVSDAAFAEPLVPLPSKRLAYEVSGAASHFVWGLATYNLPSSGYAVVEGIGDIDGDTIDDIAIMSHPTTDFIELFSGDSRTVISRHCVHGGTFPACGSGTPIISAQRLNDLNNDGVADFAVGLPSGLTGEGEVRVYSGADRTVIRTLANESQGDLFGSALANIGDLDGDGGDDIVVGAVAHSGTNQSNGYVRCFSGKTGQVLFTIVGQDPDGSFAHSVANIGDLNGDGKNDVAIGEPQYAPNTTTPSLGRVHLYLSPLPPNSSDGTYRLIAPNTIVHF